MLGYTTRAQVEAFAGKTFSSISDASFNKYIEQSEAYINNYLGYNSQTTTSGILTEFVEHEKIIGKVDAFNNLVVDIYHAPVHIDAYGNPQVTDLEYSQGGIHSPLQLDDSNGKTGRYYSLIDLSENGRKLVYPSLYFFPAISTVTPTAKVNLFSLRDVRFYVTISYIGGYNSVPADIEAAANYLTLGFCTVQDNPTLADSVRQGTFSIDYVKGTQGKVRGNTPFIQRANELLQPYVRVTW